MPTTEPTLLPSRTSSITIAVERLAQLHALANRRNKGLVDLIDGIINDAIAAGEIPDELPGFDVFRDDDAIVLTIRGKTLPMIPNQTARAIAHVLDAASGKTEIEAVEGFSIAMDKAVGLKLQDGDVAHDLAIARHGRGVLLTFRNNRNGEIIKTGLAPGIATDLARMIRSALQTH